MTVHPGTSGEHPQVEALSLELKTALAESSHLRLLSDSIPALISYVDAGERIRLINRSYQAFMGLDESHLIGRTVLDVGGQEHYAIAKPFIDRVLAGEAVQFDSVLRQPDGSPRHVSVSYTPDRDRAGVRGFVVMVQDETDRKRSEALLIGQKQVLELITEGRPLSQVLNEICLLVEAWTATCAKVSILVASADGTRLLTGAGPSLPRSYNEAMSGIEVGPSSGTCGRAAYLRQESITVDIANDPDWAPHRDVALPAGLRACWSTPILDGEGDLLGTFALYYPEPREPDPRDRQVVATLTQTAAVAIARQRSVEELDAARTQATAILESITDGFYALDSDWCFTYVNQEAERILQRSRGELLGKNIWEEYSPAIGTGFWHEYHRARREGKSVHWEQYYEPLGSWFALHAYPSAEGLSVYFQNINDRKRVELREAFLRRLDEAGQSLTDPLEITQSAARLLGEHLQVNRCAYADVEEDEDTFNLTGDYNRGVPSIVGRYTFEQFGKECLRLMRIGKPYVVEDSETDPRVTDVVHSYRLTLIRSVICVPLHKGGRFVAAMAVHQTTPRKWRDDEIELVQQVASRCRESIERARVERELRTSEEQFRSLANTIPHLAWMAHADGNIFWYNQRWYEYTGTRPDQMVGWGWRSIHDPDVLPKVLDLWTTALNSGEPFEMVFPLRGADGRFRHFLTRVEPVRDAQGRVVRWFGTNTDITEQQEARESLRATNEELQKVNRELEEFAYVASHDMQEPLRMVNAYTEMLLRRHVPPDNERAREYGDIIRTGVHRMEELIRDLLSYSRAVHGEEEAAGSADLSMSLAAAIEVVGTRIAETGAEILQEPLPQVIADEAQMSHVFQNLLSNALKYRKRDAPPKVRITARPEGASWVISVEDNGIGFDPQYSERIFGLFKRLHKEAYPGTGLGLAICKRIVERYGGRMWAESEPGAGSRFSFMLVDASRMDAEKTE